MNNVMYEDKFIDLVDEGIKNTPESIAYLSNVLANFTEDTHLHLATFCYDSKDYQLTVLTEYCDYYTDEAKCKIIEVFNFDSTLSEDTKKSIGSIFEFIKDNFNEDVSFYKKVYDMITDYIEDGKLTLTDLVEYTKKVFEVIYTQNQSK